MIMNQNWKFTFLLFILFVIVCVALALSVSSKRADYDFSETFIYKVEKDDTLWDIAYANASPVQDIREVVTIIKRLSKCTADIKPGDYLTIPVFINK